MRIIAVRTLRALWEQAAYRDAEQPLRTWVQVVKAARWRDPTEVKRVFNSADILREGRVFFDISGNQYRLIARVNYHYGIVYIRFVGSHAEYDRVDAQSVYRTSTDAAAE